tara:strand:+ start:12546 stop:13367 length:822 start_codon:yes stop_codon:yes gene_type:complete
MKHTYKIDGATSEGNRIQVEKILSKVEGVIRASVDLEKSEAVIEMQTHIPIKTFLEALQEQGSEYSIEGAIGNFTKMEHTYMINGMYDNEGRDHVHQMLSKVDGVTEVSVDLQNGEAVIEMRTHIFIETFQKVLQEDGGRYSIHIAKKDRAKMGHTYHIHGMTGNDDRAHVQKILSKVEGVTTASVDLEKGEAVIEMESHIPIETFQMALLEDGDTYSIHVPDEKLHKSGQAGKELGLKEKGTGAYHCPMFCEGKKTYNTPGKCPVCSMDLVE